jgi:hypothetical protein
MDKKDLNSLTDAIGVCFGMNIASLYLLDLGYVKKD